jgi:hypothetical protein
MAQTRCSREIKDGEFWIVLRSGPFPTKAKSDVFAEWLRQALLTATDQEFSLGEKISDH